MKRNVVINGHVFVAELETRIKVTQMGTMTINGITLESEEHDDVDGVIAELKQMAARLKLPHASHEENKEDQETLPMWMARNTPPHSQLVAWNNGEAQS
jgi:hypothetical protein